MLREKALEEKDTARRMEEQKNNAFKAAPRRPRPRARVSTLEQMSDHARNDQPGKLDPGAGSTTRARAAASSSSNGHLEEELKGQAQQAGFLQHSWAQQTRTQTQQALQQLGGCSDGGHSAAGRGGSGASSCSQQGLQLGRQVQERSKSKTAQTASKLLFCMDVRIRRGLLTVSIRNRCLGSGRKSRSRFVKAGEEKKKKQTPMSVAMLS